MARMVQVSAQISKETKDLLDRHSRATGVKKGYLIEAALRYHIEALQELPADTLVPPRLVLTRHSFEQVAARLRSPGRPSAALRRLMRDDGD